MGEFENQIFVRLRYACEKPEIKKRALPVSKTLSSVYILITTVGEPFRKPSMRLQPTHLAIRFYRVQEF